MVKDNNCFDVEEARHLISDPRYIIDDYIGAGAMACVYKVHERGSPNVYALKLLREEYRQRTKFLEFFEREAIHMRDLQYPNIVRFYKFVIEERSAYILMDYVQGKPLTHYIKEVRETNELLPIDKIMRIIAQVARAISYLHQEGFIHRDVKPGNILLVGENESAFLTDLGIAGASDEPALQGAGTPSYMPYEQQIKGTVDHTVDIYAFAIMLFELITGKKPFIPEAGLSFKDARRAMVEMHRKADIPSISSKRDDLPQELDAFFEQALAKNPSQRYLDVLDFAQDIHEFLLPQLSPDLQDFDKIQAQAVEPIIQTNGEAVAPTTDYRVILGGLALLAAIFLLVTGGVYFNNQNAESTAPASIVAEATETPTVEPTATITATATLEPSPTITPSPSPTPAPTAILEDVSIFALAEGVTAIGFGDDLNETVNYIASIREGFVPLQFGEDVNGFRVELALREGSINDNQSYGIAFRIQDESNYLLLVIEQDTSVWALRAIEAGEMRVLASEAIDGNLPLNLALSAEDEFIRIEFDERMIEQSYDNWQNGAVALWLPLQAEQSIALASLDISLIGADATFAEGVGGTDIQTLMPLHFVLDDVQALRATGDENAIVDCVRFLEIYMQLEQHLVIEEAADFVSQVQVISTFIFRSCEIELDNTALEFSFSDYLNWETDLDTLIAANQAAQ